MPDAFRWHATRVRAAGWRRRPTWVAALLALALAWSAGGWAHAVAAVSNPGIPVHGPHPERAPQRIVSALPSLTESVCALGACDRLVGVDRYSNWPDAVHKLPRVGGGIDPQVEAIVALRPDLVLVASSSRAAERLRALGLRVVEMEPKRMVEVRDVLHRLDALLGTQAAAQVWGRIEADLDAIARSLPPAARGVSVYVEVSPGPWAAGSVSFSGELLARLGARNIVPPELGPFPKLNPEFVVRADPDVIVIPARGAQGLEQRPGWGGMRAVQSGRVCRLSDREADTLARPGPRLAEGAKALARCLAQAPGAPQRP